VQKLAILLEEKARGAQPESEVICQWQEPLDSLAFSKDDRQLVCLANSVVTVWDLKKGQERTGFPTVQGTTCVALSGDANHIATGGYDGRIRVIDSPTRGVVREYGSHNRVEDPIRFLSYSQDGKFIIACRGNANAYWHHRGVLEAWDIDSGEKQWTFAAHERAIHSASYCSESNMLATASSDGNVRIWDVTRLFQGKR
jgi:WD40 repeat protein